MTNPTQGVVNTGRAKLAYEMVGEAVKGTLVLSHPLFFDQSIFRFQTKHFADEYRVVTYDHRGHGRTGAATDGRYDAEALADDAIVLIETLGLGPVHFAGNSLGGFVALRLAARRPDLLRSAIALGSSGDEEDDPDHLIPLYDHLLQHGGKGAEDAILNMMFGDAFLGGAEYVDERQKWRDHVTAQGPLLAGPAGGVVFRGAINRSLVRSVTPILALAGADDKVYAPRFSEAIAATAPKGEWKTIPLAGHCVALEQPEVTNAVMGEFLARVG